MDIIVKTCKHTSASVLVDVNHDMCLHNETIEQDLADVQKYNTYCEAYLKYIADNGLDNDFNSIGYADLIEFVDNHLEEL